MFLPSTVALFFITIPPASRPEVYSESYSCGLPRSFKFCLHLQEQFVEVGVFVELGVEGDAELVALAGGDDATVDFG